jgi:hypothetical protein
MKSAADGEGSVSLLRRRSNRSCPNSCVSTRVAIAARDGNEVEPFKASLFNAKAGRGRGDIVLKNLAIGSQTGMLTSVAM